MTLVKQAPVLQEHVLALVFVASLVIHAAAYAALGTVRFVFTEPPRQDVSFEVVEPPPVVPVATAAAPTPDPALPAPRPAPRVKAPEPTPAEAPPPPKEVPVDFGNVTMTNEGQSSWAVAPSSGVEQSGPIAGPGKVTGRSQEGAVGGTGDRIAGPVIVGTGDLSERPAPPASLNRLLEEHYPKQARQGGITGVARVKVRLMPDGSPRVMAVLSESAAGFGEACRQTLNASPKWSPGIDKSGRPAATEFAFTCRFEFY